MASYLFQKSISDMPPSPRPVSNVFGLLPASTPLPLPASHLSGLLQDSLDQCLHNAPKKNDPLPNA